MNALDLPEEEQGPYGLLNYNIDQFRRNVNNKNKEPKKVDTVLDLEHDLDTIPDYEDKLASEYVPIKLRIARKLLNDSDKIIELKLPYLTPD